MTLQRIRIEGSPIEMGGQHGDAFGSQIVELAQLRYDLLRRTGADHDLVKTAAEGVFAEINRHMPEIALEALATADAAGIEPWRLVIAGGYSDIHDLVSRRLGTLSVVNECTLLVSEVGGRPLIAGTWDTHASAIGYAFVCHRVPVRGAETLGLSTVGWPLQQGLSSRGVAVAIANLVSRHVADGVSFVAALGSLADAGSAVEFIDTVTRLPHCSARFYIATDPGESFGAEVVPDGAAVVRSGAMQHTNHFVFDPDAEGRPPGLLGTSIARLDAARLAIGEPHADTAEAILDALTVAPIAQHGTGDDDATGIAFVLDPAAREIHYRLPTESERFTSTHLERLFANA